MSNQVSVGNPFAQAATAPQANGMMAETKSQREATEVQAMVIMAKQFPRDQIRAMDRILNACTRQSLAEGAVYSYPKGGQNVEGPSIPPGAAAHTGSRKGRGRYPGYES